ncbi:hypothetical protein AB9F34_34405, partial [Rhizobium leguminosarum]|uniref:hypothetical protein n=1 Tax=Rhizobium leguminosarum TaxID=384 RepID=UPI003F99054E
SAVGSKGAEDAAPIYFKEFLENIRFVVFDHQPVIGKGGHTVTKVLTLPPLLEQAGVLDE